MGTLDLPTSPSCTALHRSVGPSNGLWGQQGKGTAGHAGSSPWPGRCRAPGGWALTEAAGACSHGSRPPLPALALGGGNCTSNPVQCVVLGLPVAMATSSKACDVPYPEGLTVVSLDQDRGVQSGTQAASFTHSPAPWPVLGTGVHGGQAGTHRVSHGHSGNHSAHVGRAEHTSPPLGDPGILSSWGQSGRETRWSWWFPRVGGGV